jgi:hypothetical protein
VAHIRAAMSETRAVSAGCQPALTTSYCVGAGR